MTIDSYTEKHGRRVGVCILDDEGSLELDQFSTIFWDCVILRAAYDYTLHATVYTFWCADLPVADGVNGWPVYYPEIVYVDCGGTCVGVCAWCLGVIG